MKNLHNGWKISGMSWLSIIFLWLLSFKCEHVDDKLNYKVYLFLHLRFLNWTNTTPVRPEGIHYFPPKLPHIRFCNDNNHGEHLSCSSAHLHVPLAIVRLEFMAWHDSEISIALISLPQWCNSPDKLDLRHLITKRLDDIQTVVLLYPLSNKLLS